MGRLFRTGLSMAAGGAIGVFASGSLLGGAMGAILGAVAAIIVFSFPRERDYPPSNDSFLGN